MTSASLLWPEDRKKALQNSDDGNDGNREDDGESVPSVQTEKRTIEPIQKRVIGDSN